MRKIFNWILKSKRYSFNRKYALKQYENIDLYVEGLETLEEVKKELAKFDELAEEYRKKEESINNSINDNVEVKEVNNKINEIIQQRPF